MWWFVKWITVAHFAVFRWFCSLSSAAEDRPEKCVWVCFVLSLNKSEPMPASTLGVNVDNNSFSVLSSQSASNVALSRQAARYWLNEIFCVHWKREHAKPWGERIGATMVHSRSFFGVGNLGILLASLACLSVCLLSDLQLTAPAKYIQ